MKRKTEDDQLIQEYLLGSLPPNETERLDELSFTDEQFASHLEAVENDLIDAYVRGELQQPLLDRFKTFYLSSALRREKVQFAEDFLRSAKHAERHVMDDSEPTQVVHRPSWRGIFALPKPAWATLLTTAALLLVAIGLLLFQDIRLRRQRDDARAAEETFDQRVRDMQGRIEEQQAALAEKEKDIESLSNTLARLDRTPVSENPDIVAFVLQPQTRSISRMTTLSVPREADFVTLQLELESDEFPTYQATVMSLSDRQIVLRRADLRVQNRSNARVIFVSLGTARLEPKNYMVELSGQRGSNAEIVSSYTFGVVRD